MVGCQLLRSSIASAEEPVLIHNNVFAAIERFSIHRRFKPFWKPTTVALATYEISEFGTIKVRIGNHHECQYW